MKIVRSKQHRLYVIVKQTLLAYMNGSVPQVALEYYERPSIDAVDSGQQRQSWVGAYRPWYGTRRLVDQEGAETIIELALLPPNSRTARFEHAGQALPW